MPGPFQFPRQNGLLGGLFGTFQGAAQGGLDTASIWSTLRQAAATWQFQASGGGDLPPPDELEKSGAEILSQAGVNAPAVSTYRGIAGKWLGAKTTLHAADLDQQITAPMIFQPPWATTTGPEQDSRYRLRIEWEITPTNGDVFTKWHSYELTAPLTSIQDALDQAGAKIAGDKYLQLLAGDSEPTINDYEIEQI